MWSSFGLCFKRLILRHHPSLPTFTSFKKQFQRKTRSPRTITTTLHLGYNHFSIHIKKWNNFHNQLSLDLTTKHLLIVGETDLKYKEVTYKTAKITNISSIIPTTGLSMSTTISYPNKTTRIYHLKYIKSTH